MSNAVSITVSILQQALRNVPVSTEVPQARPRSFVMVAQTASEGDAFIERPTMSLTCWGESDAPAYSLALSCLEALQDAAETHPQLSAVSLDTLSRDEWGATGASRYMLQLQLTINI